MKKLLFICDGDHFSNGSFQFIKFLHETQHLFVKGLFFTPVDFEQMIPVSYIPIAEPYVKLKEKEKQLVRESQSQFVSQCKRSSIRHIVHENMGPWDKELIARESRFSDLIVISEELFCSTMYLNDQPNYFMQELLREAECPVMVVPERFYFPTSLSIAYDGSRNAMFAIRQFVNMFPQLTDLVSKFVYITENDSDEIPDRDLLGEYASVHFDSFGTSKLNFDPKTYTSTWLQDQRGTMLITGSYARSGFSNLFNRSFSDDVIHEHSCPVFIAHTN